MSIDPLAEPFIGSWGDSKLRKAHQRDIVRALYDAVHEESAAIAPQTSPLIETAKVAALEVTRLRAALEAVKDRLLLAWQEGPDTTDSDEACGIYYDYIGEAITAIDAAL